ncbi:type I secretion system permease/ATPase [Cysteiniphilum halobium]|uniref:type I secretion system permease/ATPase n=1 Tax=Cysteiniphilum halobium TaxID=2219059 RepID=UPI000E64F2DD|nr:ATP-binding cassette domain-containing protein [Cysteiniphilum halobium]
MVKIRTIKKIKITVKIVKTIKKSITTLCHVVNVLKGKLVRWFQQRWAIQKNSSDGKAVDTSNTLNDLKMAHGDQGEYTKDQTIADVLSTCKIVIKYMLVFGAICNLLLLSSTIYVMQVLDRVLSSGSYETLWMLTIITLLALLLLATIQGGRVWLLSKVAQWLEKKLSGALFASSIMSSSKLEKAVKKVKTAKPSALLSSLHTLKNYLTSPAFIAVIDLPWALLFIVVLFILHVYIGWLTVFGAVVLILVAILSHRTSKPLTERYQKRANDSAQLLSQAQQNHESLQTMGGMEEIQQDWQRLNDETQQVQLTLAKRQTMMSEMSKFFRLTLQIFVTGLGAYLVLINEFTAGAIIASSALVGRALQPIEMTIGGWKNLMGALQAYRQLKSHQGEVITYNISKTTKMVKMTKTSHTDSHHTLQKFQGSIQVEKVYYGLQGDQLPILQNINFTVAAGRTLVIMGHNGAGKSTLAKLLVGLVTPEMGQVLLNHKAISDGDNQQLAQHMGYLPQTVHLFKAPIWRNIARMASDYDAEKVIKAAQMIGADKWIDHLSEGYNTKIDPQQLSAGQIQQLGLARAFYGAPRLLVLDEPSHFLDGEANRALSQSLQSLKANNMTMIIISHDPTMMEKADDLLILQQGQILLSGEREKVLQKMGHGN